jgi:hypothetical protein
MRKVKYKLVRKGPSDKTRFSNGSWGELTVHGEEVAWIEWNTDKTYKSTFKEVLIGRSLIVDPQYLSYGWLTTTVTEIIEQKEDYIRFKTVNSEYELFKLK